MWAKKKHGFTIVELLIVIVVIAILATISVVTYSGVQRRAQNVQVISAVDQWETILKMYMAYSGAYPAVTGSVNPAGCAPLLGNAQSEFTNLTDLDGDCKYAFDSAMIANIKSVTGSTTLPKGRLPDFGATNYPGIRYISSPFLQLEYVQYGNGCLSKDTLALYVSSINSSLCRRSLT